MTANGERRELRAKTPSFSVPTGERGKRADVVAVDGNPLEDIEAVGRVVAVIRDGQLVWGPVARVEAGSGAFDPVATG